MGGFASVHNFASLTAETFAMTPKTSDRAAVDSLYGLWSDRAACSFAATCVGRAFVTG
jgi:hypothetical protein